VRFRKYPNRITLFSVASEEYPRDEDHLALCIELLGRYAERDRNRDIERNVWGRFKQEKREKPCREDCSKEAHTHTDRYSGFATLSFYVTKGFWQFW